MIKIPGGSKIHLAALELILPLSETANDGISYIVYEDGESEDLKLAIVAFYYDGFEIRTTPRLVSQEPADYTFFKVGGYVNVLIGMSSSTLGTKSDTADE